MANHHQLQRARNLLDLTLAEAAEQVGASRSEVSLMEGGQVANPPLADRLTALYETQGVVFGNDNMVGLRRDLIKMAKSPHLH